MTELKTYDEISSLWLEYRNGLKYYMLKKVKNEEVANDLTHEVLMKVYDSCCSSTNIRNVKSWMFQIAHNTMVDHFKKQQKFTNTIPEYYADNETVAYQESSELLGPLIELLPEKYAVPLRLSDIDMIKQKEVAEKINLSLTATKSRIQRGRKLLKQKIIQCSNLELDEKGNVISFEIKSNCEAMQKKLKKNE